MNALTMLHCELTSILLSSGCSQTEAESRARFIMKCLTDVMDEQIEHRLKELCHAMWNEIDR